MADVDRLAVEVAELRGELTSSLERVAGRMGSLEAEIKGHLNTRQAEVDGKLAMLTSITSDLRETQGHVRSDLDQAEKDQDALAHRQREAADDLAEAKRDLAEVTDAHRQLAEAFARYLAERSAAREREEELRTSSERARRIAAWAITVAAAIVTTVWTVQQIAGG